MAAAAGGSRGARRPVLLTPRGSGDRTVFLFDRRWEQADLDEKVLSYGKDNYRGFRSAVCQVPRAEGGGGREGGRGAAAPLTPPPAAAGAGVAEEGRASQPPPPFRAAGPGGAGGGGSRHVPQPHVRARGTAAPAARARPVAVGRRGWSEGSCLLRLPGGARAAAPASLPRTFLPGQAGERRGETAPAPSASRSPGQRAPRPEKGRRGQQQGGRRRGGAGAAPGGGREGNGRPGSSPARGTGGGGGGEEGRPRARRGAPEERRGGISAVQGVGAKDR